MEIWKPVPSLPRFEASSLGRVRLTPVDYVMPTGGIWKIVGKPRKGSKKSNGYLHTTLNQNNYLVHRLVCEAFHGPANGRVCSHIDESRDNNRPENLCWVTQSENLDGSKYKARRASMTSGGWKGRVLTDNEVRAIRSRSGESRAVMAKEFGVSAAHISNVIRRNVRKNVPDS